MGMLSTKAHWPADGWDETTVPLPSLATLTSYKPAGKDESITRMQTRWFDATAAPETFGSGSRERISSNEYQSSK